MENRTRNDVIYKVAGQCRVGAYTIYVCVLVAIHQNEELLFTFATFYLISELK